MEMMRNWKQEKIKNNLKNYFLYVVLCVLFTGVFFVFEYFPKHSKGYYIAKKEAKKAIDFNDFWLDKIKQKTIGSEEYSSYLEANKKKAIKVDVYKKTIETEKFKRFKTLKIFLKEFGTYFGFFLYALFNLYRATINRKSNAVKLFHTYMLGVCVFFMYWALHPFEDVSKVSYYFISAFSTLVILTSLVLIVNRRKTTIQKLETQKAQLKKQKQEIATFTYIHTPEESKEEMLEVLDKNLDNE